MKKSKVARAVDMNDNLTDGAKGKPRRETGGGSRWDGLLTRDRRSRKRREAKWEANAESTPQVATSRKTHPFRQQQIYQTWMQKVRKWLNLVLAGAAEQCADQRHRGSQAKSMQRCLSQWLSEKRLKWFKEYF